MVEGVVRRLRADVRTGLYPVDAPLPSERCLCEELSVSRATLRQAIQRLGEEGWLIRRVNHQALVAWPEAAAGTADRLVAALLDGRNPPTALTCVNDLTAMLVVDALERAGRRVPEDVSIVGFDGLLRWVPDGGRLSTADQPFDRIGETATSLLLERLASGKAQPYRHVLLDAPWRDKGSAASPGPVSRAGVPVL